VTWNDGIFEVAGALATTVDDIGRSGRCLGCEEKRDLYMRGNESIEDTMKTGLEARCAAKRQ